MAERTAEITSGRVRGRDNGGVAGFLGIPYASPPVGANRFRPPRPVERWAGTRDALSYGPSCVQPARRPTGWSNEPSLSEDCLYLNVWTPSTGEGSRPVMVWIHGGGYSIGSGSWPLYDGTALARRGDVVVVTLNHRLGPFGYLHLGAVAGEEFATSGNNGQLDLLAALEWVRDNISTFGGDPTNVTVFGESGGGAKITTLLAMPAASGLFQRAVIQSGPGLRATKPDRAEATTQTFLDSLGIGKDNLDELWSVPAERLIGEGSGLDSPMALGPVVDGVVLPKNPYRALEDGSAHDVPVVVGCNADEGAGGLPAELDDQGLRARLGRFGEEHVDEILEVYRGLFPDASNLDILSYAITDSGMRAGSIRLAEQKGKGSTTPTYMYFFTYQLAGRAGHGYEIQFIFDNVGEDASERRRACVEAMSDAWLAYAHTSDPKHDGLATWPAYEVPRRATMVFGREGAEVVDDPSGTARELWDRLPPPPRGLGLGRRS